MSLEPRGKDVQAGGTVTSNRATAGVKILKEWGIQVLGVPRWSATT